ncbi:MAG: GNAT family N-acetyltransferase [Cellulosilyticaceae bacterium]
MEYIIREMKTHEYNYLKDFLYEAIFQPDKNNLVPKSIIERPELKVYIENFGSVKDDYCLCAEIEGKVIGAVWVRNINGYGSVDEHTVEFAISLYPDFRGYGIGTHMMRSMLEYLIHGGYSKASLAVQKDNYAFKMYLHVGFEIVDENDEEYIMIHHLQNTIS